MSKIKNDMPLLDFLNEFCDESVKLMPHQEKIIEMAQNGEKLTWTPMGRNYRPINKFPTYMLILRKNGKETSHWSCEEPDLDENIKSSEKKGYEVEKYTTQDYWRDYHLGKFEMR